MTETLTLPEANPSLSPLASWKRRRDRPQRADPGGRRRPAARARALRPRAGHAVLGIRLLVGAPGHAATGVRAVRACGPLRPRAAPARADQGGRAPVRAGP